MGLLHQGADLSRLLRLVGATEIRSKGLLVCFGGNEMRKGRFGFGLAVVTMVSASNTSEAPIAWLPAKTSTVAVPVLFKCNEPPEPCAIV